MRKHRSAVFFIVAMGCTSCTTQSPRSDSEFCGELAKFARSVQGSEMQSVRLAKGGSWMVDHYKSCGQAPETPAAATFCRWLMENTSTEFMEANINLALSCVQGQNIKGYIGNTGIETWSGKLRAFGPRIGVYDIAIELEYNVAGIDPQDAEDFLKITVIPDSDSRE